MSFKIAAYQTVGFHAEAEHSSDGKHHWVKLTVKTREATGPDSPDVTLFFAGPNAEEQVDAYAAAINAVSRSFVSPSLVTEAA